MNKALLAAVLLLALAGCATNPLSQARFWRLSSCSNVASYQVRFNRPDNSTIATVSRSSCERLAAAAGKIQTQAGINVADIFIADIEKPNAFATKNKNGQDVVVVTIAMLDADRKSTRLNSSHIQKSRMPSSA